MIPISKQQSSYQKHYHPEEKSGICVVRRKGESVDDLIKRFRKKYSKSGLSKELRDRMYYEKPSDKRRRKKMQSIRNVQKEEEKRKQQEEYFAKEKQKRQALAAKNRRKENTRYDKSSSRQTNRKTNENA